MFTAIYSKSGERPARVSAESEVARLARDGSGSLWVDFEAPTDDDRRLLSTGFAFHPLAVEGALAASPYPRFNDYGEYLTLTFHSVRGTRPLVLDEIDAFVGVNVMVTVHARAIPGIEAVRKRCLEVESAMRRGPDRVLADLLDEVADGHLSVMADFDRAIDGLEEKLFKRASTPALREVFSLKKEVLHLKRVVSPLREVLNRLARGEFKPISREEGPYFRDVYDRVARVVDMVESFRDVVSGAMETYLTVVSNRTNEVVKILTVFSIILMSMSLIAGVYGMNVTLPLQEWRTAWPFALLVLIMGGTGAGLLAYFRVRKWI